MNISRKVNLNNELRKASMKAYETGSTSKNGKVEHNHGFRINDSGFGNTVSTSVNSPDHMHVIRKSKIMPAGDDKHTHEIDKPLIKSEVDTTPKFGMAQSISNLTEALDILNKARVTKYYKREKIKGKWKYYYTKAQYDKAKGKTTGQDDKSFKIPDRPDPSFGTGGVKSDLKEDAQIAVESFGKKQAVERYENSMKQFSEKEFNSIDGKQVRYKHYLITGTEYEHPKGYGKKEEIKMPEGYNKKVWDAMVEEAKKDKKWAEEKKNDKKWLNEASDMSKDMLKERLSSSVEQLAKKSYDYLKMRASLKTAGGDPIAPDMKKKWEELSGEDTNTGKEKVKEKKENRISYPGDKWTDVQKKEFSKELDSLDSLVKESKNAQDFTNRVLSNTNKYPYFVVEMFGEISKKTGIAREDIDFINGKMLSPNELKEKYSSKQINKMKELGRSLPHIMGEKYYNQAKKEKK